MIRNVNKDVSGKDSDMGSNTFVSAIPNPIKVVIPYIKWIIPMCDMLSHTKGIDNSRILHVI